MADIFISYSNEDRGRVSNLAETLEGHGWSVWWDRRIEAGKSFQAEIERELDSARCVVVVWSSRSVASDWVKTEAEEARRRGVLVPALLGSCKIPLAFRHMQAVNLSRWAFATRSSEFDKLLAAISKVAPRPNNSDQKSEMHWPLPYSRLSEHYYHAAVVSHEKNPSQLQLGVKNRVPGSSQVSALPVGTLHVGSGESRRDIYLYELTFMCLRYVPVEEFHAAIERYLLHLHSYNVPASRD
jgi:hypothetical protein